MTDQVKETAAKVSHKAQETAERVTDQVKETAGQLSHKAHEPWRR